MKPLWLIRLLRYRRLTDEQKREAARVRMIREAWGKTIARHIADTTYPSALS